MDNIIPLSRLVLPKMTIAVWFEYKKKLNAHICLVESKLQYIAMENSMRNQKLNKTTTSSPTIYFSVFSRASHWFSGKKILFSIRLISDEKTLKKKK